MDLSAYLGKWVKVDTSKGYYYLGVVLRVEDDSLTIRDKNGNLVTLKNEDILNVREVRK